MTQIGTSRREQCIAALLECKDIVEASQSCGVPRRTLYRWLSQSDFRKELETSKRQLVSSTVNRLRLASRGAVDVLKDIAHDSAQPAAAARVSAAKAIVSLCIEAVAIADIEERVRQLEQVKTIDSQAVWRDEVQRAEKAY
jgi:hypothetical protein